MKKQFLQAPALALPDLAKPFDLYIYERRGNALRSLAGELGPLAQVVAYFSKQLDGPAEGWPPCLRAGAATTTHLNKAEKLTFGQPVTV